VALVKRWIVEGAKFDGSSKTALLKTLLGPRVHPAAPASYRTPVPVLALAFVPSGKQIAVGGYNEVTLWDSETGKLVRRIGSLPQRIQSLQVSKDGKSLLVGGGIPGEYGEVALVELATGKRRVLDTFGDLVLTARFNTDETKVAAGGAEASVRCYDIKNGERLWSMSVHADWVTSVAFSADGKYVASASRDHTVKVYEANGTLYTTYGGHNRQIGQYKGQDPVYSVCFTGNTALSVGGGKWVQQWEPEKAKAESGDAGDMEERFFKQGHARFLAHGCDKDIYQLCLKDGQVFTLASDGIVKQLDLISQKEIRSFGQSGEFAFSLDADVANKRLVTGSFDGTVRVFDLTTGEQKLTFIAFPKNALF
jgi:WD40 repeat protein